MTFTADYLAEVMQVAGSIRDGEIESLVEYLRSTREFGGRLFIIGSGGSAANASHAVADFRKICDFEAYAPADNLAELTARINDDGWRTSLRNWLIGSRLRAGDLLLGLSVGGGDRVKEVSGNIVEAFTYAKMVNATTAGIVGRDGGYIRRVADVSVVIPTVNPDHVTPHTEAFQAVIWHLIVSHPRLKVNQTKWESYAEPR